MQKKDSTIGSFEFPSDVMIIRLHTGENVIARIIGFAEGTITLAEPMSLFRADSGDANSATIMIPLNTYGDSKNVTISGASILFVSPATKIMASYYEVTKQYINEIWMPTLENITQAITTNMLEKLSEMRGLDDAIEKGKTSPDIKRAKENSILYVPSSNTVN